MEQMKTRVATKKALAAFSEKFNLDEAEISKLLGKAYLGKMKKQWIRIDEVIKFKFKTMSALETTSNQDVADFIKSIIDGQTKQDLLQCRNEAELKALTNFFKIIPELRLDVFNNGQTYLSKYPQINDIVLSFFEKKYYETEGFWKKKEVTRAMVLSPTLRDNIDYDVDIHCYTQRSGDVLITTEKHEWKGTHYSNEDSNGNNEVNNSIGCVVLIIFFLIIVISYFKVIL